MQPRHLMQERIIVERQPVGDLVQHGELGAAEQIGLPQRQHLAAQLLVGRLGLLRRQLHPFALVEKRRDLHLAIHRALAPDFGRMRCQHRADLGIPEKSPEIGGAEAGVAGMGQGLRQHTGVRTAAGRGRRAHLADVVLVFGDVGEMRKIAEGAHDAHGLADRHAVEDGLELAPRQTVLVAVETDRGLANALDQVEGVGAFLVPHGVAEDTAEQPYIVAQPGIFFRRQASAERLDRISASEGMGRHILGRHRLAAPEIARQFKSVQFFAAVQDEDRGDHRSKPMPHPEERPLGRVSKDDRTRGHGAPGMRASSGTREDALLTMRVKSVARRVPNRDRAGGA